MRWSEVREGDVIEWLANDDEIWLVLESSIVKKAWRIRLLNLVDAEVLEWDRPLILMHDDVELKRVKIWR